MPKLLLTVGAIASLYTIWVVFVFVFVSTLSEIKKKSWHYKLYKWAAMDANTYDACHYRGKLMLTPLVGMGVVILGIAMFVGMVFRLLYHWIILPLVAGKIPHYSHPYSVGRYFERLIDFDSYVPKKSFMPGSPLLFLCLAGFGFELYRISGGDKGPVETYTTLGVLIVGIAVIGTVFAVKRPSAKHLWETLRERFCTRLPVTD